MIIALDKVTKTFGDRTLFADVSVQVNKGDRYALVGPNGAGKTTLLEIMASIQSPDEGRVNRARGISVGYLEQEAIEMKGKTVLAEVIAAASEITALEDAPAEAADRFRCRAQRRPASRWGWRPSSAVSSESRSKPSTKKMTWSTPASW